MVIPDQLRQPAQVLELVVRPLGAHVVDAVGPVDPTAAEAGGFRAADVAVQRVADVHHPVRPPAGPLQGHLEDPRGRLVAPGVLRRDQPGDLDAVLKQQKDHKPLFEYGVDVRAVTGSALRVRGAVKDAALDLWSADGNVKKLRWRLSRKSGRWHSSIHADPDSGRLVLDSAGLDLNRSATVRQAGVSGTDTPAHNLRGIDVTVPRGLRELKVSFPPSQAEVDGRYSITVQPNWITRDAVVQKTATGFHVAFSEAAPGNAKIDWQLIR